MDKKWRIVKEVRKKGKNPSVRNFTGRGCLDIWLRKFFSGNTKVTTSWAPPPQILQNTKVTTYPIYGYYPVWAVGNSLKHYLWWQKRNSLALAVGCKRMMPRTRIITNNGSESLFVAQKKKKYGASMRLVSRESEYGSLCSGVPSSASPKSRYKVVLWFLVWQISLILS